jgi:hypothetical protein
MFLNIKDANSGINSLDENLKLADISAKKLATTIGEALNPITTINKAFEIQQLSAKAIRTTMGLTTEISKELDNVMANVTLKTLDFGIGVEDNIKLFSALNNQMLRNTFLTETQIENMQAFGRATGLSAEEVAKMVTGFDTIGIGITDALTEMTKIRQTAVTFGLNVNDMMKKVSENIKVLNAFNFKDGIEGFTKMVAKAQALRIDFSKTVALAETLLDPEKAIELAAGMQMLGSNVGDLADPFKILYLAQNDIAGLQDELLKAAANQVLFNESTGGFEITQTAMYNIREQAKLTGKSYQELADEAIKAASRTKKMEMLDLSGVSDKNKELLASIGQIRGGTLEFTMPDNTVKKLEEVIGDESAMEELTKISEMAKLSDREMAEKQLTVIEKMANEIAKTGFITTRAAIISPDFTNSIDKMLGDFNKGLTKVTDRLELSTKKYITGVNQVITQSYPEQTFDAMSELITTGINNLEKTIRELTSQLTTFNVNFILGIGTRVNDFISTPSSERLLTSPEGTVKINDNDLLIGGTNLFDNGNNTITTNSLESFFMKQLDVLKQTTNLISENKQQVVDVRLSMDGDIDLSLNNLPMNNMSQDMLMSLMNNPDFKNKILQIVNKSNNFYS